MGYLGRRKKNPLGRRPSKSKGLEVGMGQVGFSPVHERLADFYSPQDWASAWSPWTSLLI